MEPLRLSLDYWLVMAVDIQETVLLGHPDLVTGSFQLQVGQVFAPVDPVTDSPLYTLHNRNENLLDHFAILHALRISQNLLYRRIHLATLGAE